MSFRIPFSRVNWITSVFLILTFLTALIAAPIYLWHYGIDAFQAGLFAFYTIATTLSITLGYHRLFSHRAFKARWPVRFATLVFGACAFENSALDWTSDHRRHHKHVDEEDDPYDISRGFFWAHIGWLFFKLHPGPPMDNVADLRKDPLVMWQHRWVQVIAVAVGFLLPAALGWLWNGWTGALGAFLLAGVTRVVIVQHSTFFINSLCHTIGRQPYSSRCSARDSTLMAFLTGGEGYHNYHHAFQHDYRNGVKPWNFDPTKWTIWLLEKIGLTSDLRRVSPEKILLAEMAEARWQCDTELKKLNTLEAEAAPCLNWQKAMETLEAISEKLAKNYEELEKSIAGRVAVSRQVLGEWRTELRGYLDQLAVMRGTDLAAAGASL